jgi:hypothetical protein
MGLLSAKNPYLLGGKAVKWDVKRDRKMSV